MAMDCSLRAASHSAYCGQSRRAFIRSEESLIQAFARAAKADLEAFPPSEERETLALVADFVVDRDR